MTKDGHFHKILFEIFQQIFENKNLVITRKSGRTDYREVEYSLPDFSVSSEARNITLYFIFRNVSESLTERQERLHRHEYDIYLNDDRIGMVKRLPKREVIFFTKPYDSRERFVDNALKNAISNFGSVNQSFEPGMRI